MNTTLQTAADGTITLEITVPWTDIQKTYETVVTETASAAEIPGFRKGKAPKEMVEENIDKTKTYEETIRRLIPKAYTDAITEHKLMPIMMPQIELKEAHEGKDWIVSAKTCERPKVTLKDYKKAVSGLKAATPKIIVPGKEDAADKKGPTVDQVLDALLTAVEAGIPDILLEHEVNHQLSQLVDQTKKLGLSVEQYLASTGKNAEGIRAEFKQQAAKNLTLEFGLEAIADKENITVTDEEVQKLLATAKSEEERAALADQKYYLTSLIRRQKTLDALIK